MLNIDPLDIPQAVKAVADHVDNCESDGREWVVGVSDNPRYSLFIYHLVDEREGQYMWCRLATYVDAREAAELCHGRLGARLLLLHGGKDVIYLYAYRLTNRTRE